MKSPPFPPLPNVLVGSGCAILRSVAASIQRDEA